MNNLQPIHSTVERYTRLSRAYVQLAERFHELDVDHLRLKGQVVPLLQTVKAQQTHIQQLHSDYRRLQHTLEEQAASHHQELQTLTKAYEDQIHTLNLQLKELQPLETVLSADSYEVLALAEEQMELVETTLQEMAEDSAPGLSEEEKALLAAYRSNPSQFLGLPANGNSHWVEFFQTDLPQDTLPDSLVDPVRELTTQKSGPGVYAQALLQSGAFESDHSLIISPGSPARSGWDKAFAAMAKDQDDLLLDEGNSTDWDQVEWEW